MTRAEKMAAAFQTVACDAGRDAQRTWQGFIRMSACAVSGGRREDEYLDEARHWDAKSIKRFSEFFGQLIDAMEAEPFTDLLGDVEMELAGKWKRKDLGQFYTPASLCRMMAGILGIEPEPTRPIDVMDCCVGAGRQLLAAAEHLAKNGHSPLTMRAWCMDIDRNACDLTFINLTLWGVPAVVVHGNALSLEEWGCWHNPFWTMARGYAETDATIAFKTLLGIPHHHERVPSSSKAVVEHVAEAVKEQADKQGQFLIDFSEDPQ